MQALPRDYKRAKKEWEIHFKRTFFDLLLKMSDGKVTKAAALCGLPRPSLSTMLKETGIRAGDYKRKRRARAATH